MVTKSDYFIRSCLLLYYRLCFFSSYLCEYVMPMTSVIEYLILFCIVGGFTLFFRAIPFYKYPSFLDRKTIKRGLESIPNTLLIALTVPFIFFIDTDFVPYRLDVLSLLLSIPIVLWTKRGGIALPCAVALFLGINVVNNIFFS